MSAPFELPLAIPRSPDRGSVERPARRARILSWLSLAWMTVEGAAAIAAGIVASSVALIGFGLDPAIEGLAPQFFLLAPYVTYESVRALAHGDQLGSAATKGEGRQNMLCAYLAGALLAGLLGNALFGAWWLDPAVGLLIAAVAVREGLEAWRGEGCCVSAPPALDAAVTAPACREDCCTTTTGRNIG